MRRDIWALGCLLLALICGGNTKAWGQEGAFNGDWRTTIGTVKLKQTGKDVSGTYGGNDQFKIKGTVDGKTLTYDYDEGNAKGNATWTLDDTGLAFTGRFQVVGGRAGQWNGWRPDPAAAKGPNADFAKVWLTTLGLMSLTQDGAKVKGKFALRGNAEVEGTVTGRHLEFKYKVFRGGKAYFDLSPDGKTLTGAAQDDGMFGWFAWTGRIAPEYARHAKLVAGKSVDGSTDGMLSYTVRAPEGYKEGDGKKWPTVVILHGSNMNGRSYVETIASAWPEVGKDFLLLGINGERPSNTTADPRFNFSYVNFVGKSTYRGFPGTDRESPALVAEALTELKATYPVAKYLVGGHSQGGFLTYSILMNYPELIAGAFPISSGLIFQCEPSAYADETLKKAQRMVPLVIVHGKTDPVVDPSMSRYAADAFREASWPAFRFIEPDQGGHMFGLLPVNHAIRWLDAMSGDDHAKLVAYGEMRLKEKSFRDAIFVLNQSSRFKPDKSLTDRETKLKTAIDAQAKPKAKDLLAQIKANKPGWIDPFLTFRDEFQFADSAKEVMTAFDTLRVGHTPPAQTAFNEARNLFQNGKPDDGYKKYQEIVDKYYASPLYRTAKKALGDRG